MTRYTGGFGCPFLIANKLWVWYTIIGNSI